MTNTQNSDISIFERINQWIRQSVMLKLAIITILMLLLLIPTSMVQSIITEREILNIEATNEVSAKWAKSQQIKGPVLTIPLACESIKDDEVTHYTRYWHILPETLDIKGNVAPKELERGIYKIVVYESDMAVSGKFELPEAPVDEDIKAIRFDQAFLTIGISDLRGIRDDLKVSWAGKPQNVTPGTKLAAIANSGINVKLPILEDSGRYDFSFDLGLQGSSSLTFVPVGSTSTVALTSSWPAPRFNGNFLPDNREVTDNGFNAKWTVLELNRNYPESWVGSDFAEELSLSGFGVDLILNLDDYQKSNRSAKYAAMTITLTFLIFFLVEILNGRKIHPFQYVLVGLALCLFYVLLVSISEHTDFNIAYGISSAAIISMITLYSLSVFRSPKLVLLLLATLIAIYGFLFVTLQLVDYALLMGSIGLTLILGTTMFLTRKVNWYKIRENTAQ